MGGLSKLSSLESLIAAAGGETGASKDSSSIIAMSSESDSLTAGAGVLGFEEEEVPATAYLKK